MVVEIRTLRVSADMNAAGYETGAAKKVAADKAMAASGKEAAATVTQQEQKISQAGDVLSRLSRQYVDGFASAQKFNQAINQLTRGVELGKIQMSEAMGILDGIYRRYGLMADASRVAQRGQTELAKAIEQANGKLAAQQKVLPANQNQAANHWAATNAMFQFQDIAVTAAGGMNPAMIGLQQGSQLAGAFSGMSGKQAGATLLSAVGGLLSPLSLATVGLTAAAAAAIQFGTNVFSSTSKAEEVLEKHEATIKRIKALYDSAGEAGEQYGRRVANAANFAGQQDRNRLNLLLKSQTSSLTTQLGVDPSSRVSSGTNLLGSPPTDAFLKGQAVGRFGPYADAILKYGKDAKSGKGDVKELNDEIFRIGNDNSTVKKWQEYATTLLGWTEQLTTTTDAVRELNKELAKNAIGQRGVTINSPAYREMLEYKSDTDAAERLSLRDMKRGYNAEIYGLGARSPSELEAAARARVAADPANSKESDAVRNYRIETAGSLARAQAEYQLKEAADQRSRSLDKSLADQQLEISLVGKTTIEAAALRREYELIAALKEQAYQSHTDVDQREIDRIKQTTAELKKMQETLAKSSLRDDLSWEREQTFRSPQDQQIAARQKSSGLPVDLNSSEAQYMRQNAYASEVKGLATDFLTNFRNTIVSNGGNIGKALGETLMTSVMSALTKAGDQAIERLVNSVFGSLFGGGAAPGAGVNVLGGAGFAANTTLGAFINGEPRVGANNNSSLLSALPSAGLTKTGISLAQVGTAGGLTAKVSSEYAPRFQGLITDLEKAGYPINSLGEGGYSYRNVAGTGNLSKHAFGEAIDINPRQNPQAYGATGNWAQYGIDPTAEAKKFGMTYGGNWNLPDTMHFQVDKTAASFEKLSDVTGSVTDGLGSVASGFGKLGSSFGAMQLSPMSGSSVGQYSGLWGGIGKLFGGISPESPLWAPNTTLGSILGAADGNESTPGGQIMVGERGREIVNLPRGSQVVPNHRTEGVLASARNSGGGSGQSGPGVINLNISGANGDEHVMNLVQHGVSQALALQNQEMIRGGVATEQQQFVRRRG